MENNYDTLRMPELKALTRECELRGYSRLRRAELIAFLQDNKCRAQRPPWMSTWEPNRPPQMSTWEPNRPPQISPWELECKNENEARQPELEAPLTKRQLKCRRNKDSKLAKKFVSLDAEIGNLKSQMEELEDKITKASRSANARFKRKKIRAMKREADKIAKKLAESEQALKLLGPRGPKDLISGAPRKQHHLGTNV